MNEPVNDLSIGFGVQSSTLALMAEKGIITPKPVAGHFGDTKWEPKSVYEWSEWLKSQLSFPIYTVSSGDLAEDSLIVKKSKKTGKKWMKGLIPAYVLNKDFTKGLLGRKCTPDYKILPIQSHIRKYILEKGELTEWKKRHKDELGLFNSENRKGKKKDVGLCVKLLQSMQSDALVVMWIGISIDEAGRMKDSRVPWIRSRWPLIEKGMSRASCLAWMRGNGYPTPPRSACTFCPFHSDEEWNRIKNETPSEFQLVVDYERKLQSAARSQEALMGIPFLHSSCKPIGEIDFSKRIPSHHQLQMFENECEGLCGV